MWFPVIKVKDDCYEGDNVHIVGSNSHDRLYIKDNAIHYMNIQCASGTEETDGTGYSFVGESSQFQSSDELEVEFLTLEEIINMAMKSMEQDTEFTLRINEMAKLYLDKLEESKKKVEESEKSTGIGKNTIGCLF